MIPQPGALDLSDPDVVIRHAGPPHAYSSANRDEEAFPDADRFNVARTPNHHLAFGIGEHFCLGASFARMQLRCILREVLTRLPDLALAGLCELQRGTVIHGVKRMPVRFGAGGTRRS